MATFPINFDVKKLTFTFNSFFSVIGAIAMTLQPLWPDSSRETLWYLSVGVFMIMGVLVCLIVGKLVGSVHV